RMTQHVAIEMPLLFEILAYDPDPNRPAERDTASAVRIGAHESPLTCYQTAKPPLLIGRRGAVGPQFGPTGIRPGAIAPVKEPTCIPRRKRGDPARTPGGNT